MTSPETPLRQRAEAQAAAVGDHDLAALAPDDVKRLLHELRVHQIELEMQNEELRRTQVELEGARARYFNLYDLAPVGYITLDEQGLILEANLAAATLLGMARGALVKWPFTHFIFLADQDTYYLHHRQLFQTDAPQTCELRLTRRDDDSPVAWVRVDATLVRDEESGALVCHAMIGNITERVRAEEALRAERTLLRALVDHLPDAVYAKDAAGRKTLANPADFRNMGKAVEAEVLGKTDFELFPPDLATAFDADDQYVFRTGQPILNREEQITWADGTLGWQSTSKIPLRDNTGQVIGLVGIGHDITARKQAEAALRESEQRLQQQERLAAVGQLAAGIAHDFNNILAVIALYASMVARAPGLTERDRERLAVISEQTAQATRLIQQILDFSRRAALERRPLDLGPLLRTQVKLLARTLPETIQVTLDCEPGEHRVFADPTRMQQIVMNLAVNARDAMPAGGILRLTLARQETAPRPDLPAGPWVRLEVTDSGTGIAPEAAAHIFEPFFTTKPRGQGTGLGLAQVYGIVKQHAGEIEAQSVTGQGATFTIYLPAVREAEPVVAPAAAELAPGADETILIVEDNPSLREALSDLVEMLGYRVLSAGNGEEALAVLDAHREMVALVLSDLVMPRMGGDALLSALRDRGLTVPMVILSGYPLGGELEELRAQGLAGWLLKPPDVDQLAQLLAQALAGRRG